MKNRERTKQTVITVVHVWLSSCVFKVRWIEYFLHGSLRTIKALSAGKSPKCHTSRLKNSWHHPAWCWLRHRIYTVARIATALASGPSLCFECTPNLYYMHWKAAFPQHKVNLWEEKKTTKNLANVQPMRSAGVCECAVQIDTRRILNGIFFYYHQILFRVVQIFPLLPVSCHSHILFSAQ